MAWNQSIEALPQTLTWRGMGSGTSKAPRWRGRQRHRLSLAAAVEAGQRSIMGMGGGTLLRLPSSSCIRAFMPDRHTSSSTLPSPPSPPTIVEGYQCIGNIDCGAG